MLGERRQIIRVSRRGTEETVCIVEGRFVEQVPAVKMILSCLYIQPYREVVGLGPGRQSSFDLGKLKRSVHAVSAVRQHRGIRDCAGDRRGIPALDGVSTKALQCLQGRSVAVARKD